MTSCYDKFLLKLLRKEEMCAPCSNYYGESEKKKAQNQMGRRFRCICLSPPHEKQAASALNTSSDKGSLVALSTGNDMRIRFRFLQPSTSNTLLDSSSRNEASSNDKYTESSNRHETSAQNASSDEGSLVASKEKEMRLPFRFLHRAPNNNLVDASSQIEESSSNESSVTNSNHDIFDDSASFNSGEIILSPPRKLRLIRASPARIASPRESQQ